MTTQTQLDAFAGTSTESVAQTVVVELESSDSKNETVRTAVVEFGEMADLAADFLPSFPEDEWGPRNTSLDRLVEREYPDRTVMAQIRQRAVNRVGEAFKSWRSNGKSDNRPTFDNVGFVGLSSQGFDLVENDRGYGFKAKLFPRNPVWFHIDPNGYQQRYFDRIFDGDADTGSCELHLEADGTLRAHLVIRWDVEVYKPTDVSTAIGVDIGERVIYCAAAVTVDGIEEVQLEPGSEFRHHRDRLNDKRRQLSKQGDLRAVKQCRGDRRRYTEQVLHTASRKIVDMAVEHKPTVVVLEDLTGYRKRTDEAIHDWPYANLQEKIAYKAKAAGIPVTTVDARNTSISCRKCPGVDREYRDGNRFRCSRCEYEVHADVNAAINIANRQGLF